MPADQHQFAFLDLGAMKLILKCILVHLKARAFYKLYRQTSTGDAFTELWHRCSWKQSKGYGEDLPGTVQRMQTGINRAKQNVKCQ